MVKDAMAVEERLRSKRLHKMVLYSVKVIPIIVCGIYLLNTILSYFDIDAPVLSYIVQFLFIGFIYLASVVFKFCKYHRIFIHYILLNIIDYHWGIPVSNKNMFLIYMIITGLFLFLALYYHQKTRKP